jgi:DNA gyrase subunit A
MLTDIDKDTVDFVPNYDEEFTEPTVLPAHFPNLLVNGSSGIAVGMSTNMPPHNLTDVITAVIRRIDDMRENIETPIDDLIEIIKAPDYPTGGTILGTQSIREAYLTGRGRVVLRASAIIEPMTAGRDQIRVTAIPYQVNKANLVKKMADLVKDKKIDGITDIRDEYNRNGVRIIIELRKDANANVVLNQLYKLSPLQESYGIIMLALVKNEPKILTLAELIEYYIEHQKVVITRRTRFDLAKAERRAHILEGLLRAQDFIDEIIALIRSSDDGTHARNRLMETYQFTDIQAQAIVDMRLRALTGLEKQRIEKEHGELQIVIAELNHILSDGNYLLQVLKDELTIVKNKFGDERKTLIDIDPNEINIEDLIDDAQSVITLSNMNYIKRIPLDAYHSQKRGGKGVIGMQTREEDWVKDMFVANTHDYILFFTTKGRAFSLRAFGIPEAGRQAKGVPLVNLLNLAGGEDIAAMIPVTKNDWGGYLVMVTREGLVMRITLDVFSQINKTGKKAMTFRDDDMLIAVLRSDGNRELFLATLEGRGIRFHEEQIRASSNRGGKGIRGIKLREDDQVVGATVADGQVLLVSSKGYGKCTLVEDCRGQSRAGKGIIIYKPSETTGTVVGIESATENDGLILINSNGVIIRIRVADIRTVGRYAKGVKLINMDDGVTVVGMAKIVDDDNNNENDNEVEDDDNTIVEE